MSKRNSAEDLTAKNRKVSDEDDKRSQIRWGDPMRASFASNKQYMSGNISPNVGFAGGMSPGSPPLLGYSLEANRKLMQIINNKM